VATTYDWPAGICFTDCTLTVRSAVGVATSPYSFARETQDWGGDRWSMSLQFLRQPRADAAILEAFLLKLRGGVNKVRLGDPWCSLVRGSKDGTPLSAGMNVAGATTLNTKGWTISATGVLLQNDYIQVEDSLYRVLDDVDADGGGNATIEVWPRLRKAHAEGLTITTDNARGVFALAEPTVTFSRNAIELFGTQVDLVEAL